MKGKAFFLVPLFLLCAALLSQAELPGYSRIQVRDGGTGRKILSGVLRDGDQVVMTWKNSLFGLNVTELFEMHGGRLILTTVTFAEPRGPAPPLVKPPDVDDLYHTGGSFTASGLNKPFDRIVHRVGELGEPRMSVKGREVAFKEEVGFGGSVVVTAAGAKAYEILLESGRPERVRMGEGSPDRTP